MKQLLKIVLFITIASSSQLYTLPKAMLKFLSPRATHSLFLYKFYNRPISLSNRIDSVKHELSKIKTDEVFMKKLVENNLLYNKKKNKIDCFDHLIATFCAKTATISPKLKTIEYFVLPKHPVEILDEKITNYLKGSKFLSKQKADLINKNK